MLRRLVEFIRHNNVRRVKELAALLNYQSPEALARFVKATTGMSTKSLILAIARNDVPKVQGVCG